MLRAAVSGPFLVGPAASGIVRPGAAGTGAGRRLWTQACHSLSMLRAQTAAPASYLRVLARRLGDTAAAATETADGSSQVTLQPAGRHLAAGPAYRLTTPRSEPTASWPSVGPAASAVLRRAPSSCCLARHLRVRRSHVCSTPPLPAAQQPLGARLTSCVRGLPGLPQGLHGVSAAPCSFRHRLRQCLASQERPPPAACVCRAGAGGCSRCKGLATKLCTSAAVSCPPPPSRPGLEHARTALAHSGPPAVCSSRPSGEKAAQEAPVLPSRLPAGCRLFRDRSCTARPPSRATRGCWALPGAAACLHRTGRLCQRTALTRRQLGRQCGAQHAGARTQGREA